MPAPWGAATGSRRISNPVFGRSSQNRSAVPSSVMSWILKVLFVVKRSTGPDPSDATLYRLAGPSRFDRKTIRWPSGVHLGTNRNWNEGQAGQGFLCEIPGPNLRLPIKSRECQALTVSGRSNGWYGVAAARRLPSRALPGRPIQRTAPGREPARRRALAPRHGIVGPLDMWTCKVSLTRTGSPCNARRSRSNATTQSVPNICWSGP